MRKRLFPVKCFLGYPAEDTLFLSRLLAKETFWGTMFQQQCFLVYGGL